MAGERRRPRAIEQWHRLHDDLLQTFDNPNILAPRHRRGVVCGPIDEMLVESAVSRDNLRTVPQALMTESITRLDADRMHAICQALARAAGC